VKSRDLPATSSAENAKQRRRLIGWRGVAIPPATADLEDANEEHVAIENRIYEKLVALSSHADSNRPELTEAIIAAE
jgi:hypothetical protein